MKHEGAKARGSESLRPILIAGPTAVGKSAVALELATRIGGEIISVDSMQVYRGLDIGTAKPSREERARVAHHLIDAAELTEPFDAARFVQLARKAVNGIRARERVPVFSGGTGLYFKAFLDGLGDAPAADPALRARLEATPLPELLAELAERDPATYAKIDRKNPRRVVRALEVIRLTGKPHSKQRAPWNAEGRPKNTGLFVGLTRTPDDLRGRIDARVEDMFSRGLVEETRQLLKRGLEENRTAMQAIGYRQVVEHLRGERSLEETKALVRLRTRQYARRQMTWFRRQLKPEWVALDLDDDPAGVAARLSDRWAKSGL